MAERGFGVARLSMTRTMIRRHGILREDGMPRYRVETVYREYRTYDLDAPDRDTAEERVLEGDVAMTYSKVDDHYVNNVETVKSEED